MISDKNDHIIILLSLLISLILPLTLHAQIKQTGIIKGTVIDKENGKPLKDVDIFLANTTFGTTSKPDGTFLMKKFPIGSYQLIFSHLGYIAKAVQVNLYSSNK
ncbi:MAG TPA: carboxypeptidase-like regulatory domain-containing protein [Balneolales bacterium]|nr:carboxypeptidase-like regulatory domain-containing protein [Balneolales bacterium]